MLLIKILLISLVFHDCTEFSQSNRKTAKLLQMRWKALFPCAQFKYLHLHNKNTIKSQISHMALNNNKFLCSKEKKIQRLTFEEAKTNQPDIKNTGNKRFATRLCINE